LTSQFSAALAISFCGLSQAILAFFLRGELGIRKSRDI
jgi:hypothetical protein